MKKQDDLRHELQAKCPEHSEKVRFFIGDVKNIDFLRNTVEGVNFIFHATTLKQALQCEFSPMEAVRTNIIRTDNILNAAIADKIKSVVCLSIDKAAYSINGMEFPKL